MDSRRLLILALAGLTLGGCARLRGHGPPASPATLSSASGTQAPAMAAPLPQATPIPKPRVLATMAPIPNPMLPGRPIGSPTPPAPARGRAAIAAANVHARAASDAASFQGGVQVFAYDPGRVFEVWTAPLRVTTLTLPPGETVVSKAAGDTVRWQIGETTSGAGAEQRTLVMVKPLRQGLETNLVLATSRRVYLLQLRSGAPDTFNAAVAWDLGVFAPPAMAAPSPEPISTGAATVTAGLLDAGFRIAPQGRRPAWTPTAVMTDGVRTYLAFPPGLAASEAPALFAVGPGGDTQLVNYRQQGGLWVVDRVLDRAELRLGDRRPQVVRIERMGRRS